MTSFKDSREYAEDCLLWARGAKTEEQTRLLLDISKYWLKAAERAMGITTISDEPVPNLALKIDS
jgi:hypothetical protein